MEASVSTQRDHGVTRGAQRMLRKLLVIEDDEVCRRLLKVVFEREGFAVLTAGDGKIGLAMAEAAHFDAVILDLQLPDTGGLVVLEELKRGHPGLPVIILTGQSDLATGVRAIQLGACEFVVKPLQPAVISRLVTQALTKAEAAPDASRLLAIIELQNAIAAARLDYTAVMRAAVERASALTRASGAVIELIEGDEMVYKSVHGSIVPQRGLRLPRQASLSGLCVEQRVPLRSDDTEVDPRVNRNACRKAGVASMICVPLFQGSDAIGVLKVVSTHSYAFHDADAKTLEMLAQTIAVSIQQAHLHETVVHDSYHDALTGLSNRRHFEQRLSEELDRFRRYRHPLTLVMIDLDGFKAVNDQYGHPAGDDVLREVAKLLTQATRTTDMCFRLGGDEFAIIMPDTPADQAPIVLTRLEAAAAAARLGHGIVGISAGAVAATDDDTASLVKRADAALYQVKNCRRHRR